MIHVRSHEHTHAHTLPISHHLTQRHLRRLTLIGCAVRQLHPRHSPQSSGETGSDWLIPSGGNGSQTAPRWFLAHKPGETEENMIVYVIYKILFKTTSKSF